MKTINITTHFIHSRGFSFVEETCGEKMRAPLLGLLKSIQYGAVNHGTIVYFTVVCLVAKPEAKGDLVMIQTLHITLLLS